MPDGHYLRLIALLNHERSACTHDKYGLLDIVFMIMMLCRLFPISTVFGQEHIAGIWCMLL